MSSIRERFIAVLDSHFQGNQTKMASLLGLKQGHISNIVNRGSKPSAEILAKTIEVTDTSAEWLLIGTGEMRKSDIDIQVIHTPKSIEKTHENQEVTLYDIDAAANLKTLLENKNQNILGSIKIPNLPKCDGAVYVKGDSMYPLLKSGDIVMYKEVADIQNVIFGEMYLVSMDLGGDDYLAVKYVNRSDLPEHVKLVSYNAHHEPKDIPFEAIRAIALVKASVRMNTMS